MVRKYGKMSLSSNWFKCISEAFKVILEPNLNNDHYVTNYNLYVQ